MSDPYTAQGAGLFPGSLGGQSLVVTPVSLISRPPLRRVDGKVWGTQDNAFGDFWWNGTTSSVGIITPPDTDSFDGNTPEVTHAWFAGGSDGTRHFHVAIDSTGQWWVSVFDATIGSLLDRWELTGWHVQ